MDSKIGLDYIVENKEYTTKLGSGTVLSTGRFTEIVPLFLQHQLVSHILQGVPLRSC